MDLTDEQWEVLEPPLIAHPPRRADGRGRPWREPRDVLNAILWILRTGAQPGKIFPSATLPTRPATDAFRSGSKKVRSRASSRHWPKTSRSAEGSISRNASSMAPSLWPKRGKIGGKDHAGQRYEAHGDCRRLFSSDLRPRSESRVLLRTNSPLLERLSPSALSRSVLRS